MIKNILIPITNGTEEGEAVITADLLTRADANVIIAGLTEEVTTSHNITIKPHILLSEIPEDRIYDAVCIPGGLKGVNTFLESSLLHKIVLNNYNSNSFICAICAAPLLLDMLNILQNEDKFTCYPSVISRINPERQSNYLDVPVVKTLDKNIITSQGLGTAFDFGLEIIKNLFDEETSNNIKEKIVLKKI